MADIRISKIIFAGIIAIFTVSFFNSIWLTIRPLEVSFWAKGNNIDNIEVQLSKENNADFKKYKKQIISEDIKEGKQLTYFFKKPYSPKRLKIAVHQSSQPLGGG